MTEELNSTPDDGIALPLLWVEEDEQPMLTANQFVLQIDGEQAFLTAGLVTPPILLGSPEEQRERAERLKYLQVRVVARLGMTKNRLVELRQLIDRMVPTTSEPESGAGSEEAR